MPSGLVCSVVREKGCLGPGKYSTKTSYLNIYMYMYIYIYITIQKDIKIGMYHFES